MARKRKRTFGHNVQKSEILKAKSEKIEGKLNKARKKLPKKKVYTWERTFDSKTGKAKYALKVEEKEVRFTSKNPVKTLGKAAALSGSSFVHHKISEVEKENSAVEAAHKAERTAEGSYWILRQYRKTKLQRRQAKVRKLERKHFKTVVEFRYQEFLEKNPQMNQKTLKAQIQKRSQKRRIKKNYAKQLRSNLRTGNGMTVKNSLSVPKVRMNLRAFVRHNIPFLSTMGILTFISVMIMILASSCGTIFTNLFTMTMAGSYQSVPAEIDATDLRMTELEMKLQQQIDRIEITHPDYDEYRYNIAPIGHDPFVLISYLSAKYTEFTYPQVQSEAESLFYEMYELTLNPVEEVRTRIVTKTGYRLVLDEETGGEILEAYEYEDEEEYIVKILEVILTADNLNGIVSGYMNTEQKAMFDFYHETHGLIQQFYSPLDLYWYNYVSSFYGYRLHPITRDEQFHRGVDIAVPIGMAIYASMDGRVTDTGYDAGYGNYVVIEDENGYCIKYAHMDSVSVHTGQDVLHGEIIGKSGNTGTSTGSHLHVECLYNGMYYNPLFYFEAGNITLYGEEQGAGTGGGQAVPPDSYSDIAVQALMSEAEKYVGMSYVWGGTSPITGFDCSGFISYVYSASGTYDLPRTTAQGIYNHCADVSPSEAKAGDLIFFSGTYDSGTAVTHVGIYCGNGVMLHCGDPIKYSNINTPYWQNHFYGFGRL